jgi:hypothetical protein
MVIEFFFFFFVYRKYKQVRELIVYTDDIFDIVDRHQILNVNDDTVANKFKPRPSYKRRSLYIKKKKKKLRSQSLKIYVN